MYVPDVVIRPRLEILAKAPVPTQTGLFEMIVFRYGEQSAESGLSPDHVALVMGDVRGRSSVLVRVHSECLTSEVFGSLKCDCRGQLEAAQAEIARRGQGVVVYLRQEGRGIGLSNKIRAYDLQARGHDTVDANRMLGLPDDARDYAPAAAVLEHLGVASIQLMTNNPLKVQALRQLGTRVEAREPSIVGTNPFSQGYLEAKRVRMGHSLPPVDAALITSAENIDAE
ncbi:GTP cyclohydrolase II [Polyangium sorediatum]|uniref:GTP cyclohydrolase-2 n=1 Tax=Polyangium sorediatum TaxID=889274 RepID=A0ABT6NX83_9BACT|nr:GTP cyclohydrolase II [Polyangium sorediatum]MDI1432957.1 GTP cyclohydrolase II [Polyangium sorediatum]